MSFLDVWQCQKPFLQQSRSTMTKKTNILLYTNFFFTWFNTWKRFHKLEMNSFCVTTTQLAWASSATDYFVPAETDSIKNWLNLSYCQYDLVNEAY